MTPNQTVAKSEAVADVVSKALAFKALLSSTQQATLEQAYTTTLAGRWSNLPNQLCGGCRNGLQFSTLSATQLAAALEVIKAAAGTTANEGSAEFEQIRLSDTYLNANGGGSSYGEGNYFIAFLGTPSTSGAWLLQFGGHHYAANIAYNQGHVVGATPQHEAVEPLSFTSNGTTYSPVTQERDAMAAMLASLDATQLASAKSSSTFSDCVMIPGSSTGGPSNFPTAKIGLAVSTLSSTQKQLVLGAMKPWVQDADDTVAANLLNIYQSELDSTYIAWTGSGTAGNASTFLNANTNYVRIDGPSVWIEFACQGGIVIRNQIHYHTVWRDRNRDYGKDLSLTTSLDAPLVTAASGASFAAGALAPEAIGSLFGSGMASSSASATTSLPTTLAGVQVQVKDANGTTRNAPLFYVSPLQINFQVPADTAAGNATINVVLNNSLVGSGSLTIASVLPGLFSFSQSGSGLAAAYITRDKGNNVRVDEQIASYNASTNTYTTIPIDLGEPTDQVYLIAFGTGFRYRSALSLATATIGGASATVSYAGPQGSFVGLDQANILIPRNLAGSGNVNVVFSADGKTANTVTIQIK
ncbi:MAG: DUF3500 domain-containing protein [Blastocatellia bacterium]|nr:DUF3500 domain-containing protein [Blastocatellia bacterium]